MQIPSGAAGPIAGAACGITWGRPGRPGGGGGGGGVVAVASARAPSAPLRPESAPRAARPGPPRCPSRSRSRSRGAVEPSRSDPIRAEPPFIERAHPLRSPSLNLAAAGGGGSPGSRAGECARARVPGALRAGSGGPPAAPGGRRAAQSLLGTPRSLASGDSGDRSPGVRLSPRQPGLWRGFGESALVPSVFAAFLGLARRV